MASEEEDKGVVDMTHFKRIVMNDLLSNVALSAFNIYTIWYLANVVHSQGAVALFGCAGFVEIAWQGWLHWRFLS